LSSADLDVFRRLVASDRERALRLRRTPPDAFERAAIDEAATCGLEVTPGDIASARRERAQRWLLRWIE
jgi:hypothetical protein